MKLAGLGQWAYWGLALKGYINSTYSTQEQVLGIGCRVEMGDKDGDLGTPGRSWGRMSRV